MLFFIDEICQNGLTKRVGDLNKYSVCMCARIQRFTCQMDENSKLRLEIWNDPWQAFFAKNREDRSRLLTIAILQDTLVNLSGTQPMGRQFASIELQQCVQNGIINFCKDDPSRKPHGETCWLQQSWAEAVCMFSPISHPWFPLFPPTYKNIACVFFAHHLN